MIFEIVTSVVMGGVFVATKFFESGGGNDAKKIQKICDNVGLYVKENGVKKSIRIHRKSKIEGGIEYVFQIPLGLSFKDFEAKKDVLQDGLNVKRSVLDISLDDLRSLKFNKDILKQIQFLLEKRKRLNKEIDLEFDGMLRIRVYDEPLPTMFLLDESMFNKCKGWEVPIGTSRSKFVTHDFEKVSHLIIAGATNMGKSNFIKMMITALVYRKPNDVKFTIIDLKNGLSLGRFKDLRQTENFAINPEQAKEALKKVQEQMSKTMDYLFQNGYEDVAEAGFKERHFVIIDEAADIADDKDCVEILEDIARRGRASGFYLVYATQYPTTQTVSSQVKRNCMGRLCFVVDSAIASNVVLDQSGAEDLPLIQGRAIYKTIKCKTVQVPYADNKFIQTTIQPQINIRSRGEKNEQSDSQGAENRKYTLILEETELS
ncbi:FtsK/SpoIIIE domain-containing protein [Geobacillus sp. YHL]|uniref:FtsK/SpoIIIE domain-containing protein n=1 Tax=Geobacillus sp. YHL TaxID=2796117 RepID=UPI001EF00446|nr:FtsK/SpoIIIE domain-containing protein [Geobacillus sp. YHL]MCG6796343.1 cell division protein FtsK [Geobacillus sp. YHL]